MRVEGVGSPQVAEKVMHKAPSASGIREVEKVLIFFSEEGIFFAKLAFSAVIQQSTFTPNINLKRNY
jgi:hypothetical protein